MKQFFFFLCTCIIFFVVTEETIAQTKLLNIYQRQVAELDKGNTEIDYTQFRKNYFLSEQFVYRKEHTTYFDSLKAEIEILAKNNKYFEVIRIGKTILEMDYTCMMAHQYLRQMYGYVHDSTREVKHKAIQYGLLRSMISTGDGLSCATAWEVFQTEEEYAILAMIGTRSIEHELVESPKGLCDKITVETKDGKEKVYYFKIQKLKSSLSKPN